MQSAKPNRVAEADLLADDPAMVPELEWQSRWFRGDFGRDFTGTHGEKIHITHFGYWNRSAGPDFREAVLEIDGEICAGAIELDLDVRDWEHHGHGANPGYEEVKLHLFFRQPREPFFTRTQSHRAIVQAALDPRACPDVVRPDPAPAKPGRCAPVLAKLSSEEVKSILLEAARFRAHEQSKRFHRVAAIHGREEAWFLALATALGFHANQLPMRVLAQRAPLGQLRTQPEDAEALLMGQAGFMEGDPEEVQDRPEARAYLRTLWERWWKCRGDLNPTRLPRWSLAAIRPSNHPQRRVAALATAAATWPQLLALLDATPFDMPALRKHLSGLSHPFWSTHYTLRADSLDKKVALMGPERIRDFLGNTVLPVRGDAATQEFFSLPASSLSAPLKRAGLRLLDGRSDRAPILRGSFALQQGLLQIYRDACQMDRSACADCPFPESVPAFLKK